MTAHFPRERQPSSTWWSAAAAIAGFTVLVAASLAQSIGNERGNLRDLARKEALTTYDKDLTFRQWVTGHGRVYVPATAETPPNPYLSQIPDRDITLPSGKELTLMNPAYVIRQVMGAYAEKYGVQGHLTSLKVINPVNAPDEWECRVLEQLDRGAPEVLEFIDLGGQPHLRLMKPLVTAKGCLKCHAQQGYREGDIRGGLNVNIPMAPYLALGKGVIRITILTHAGIWLLGLTGILVAAAQSRKAAREREGFLTALTESEERFRATFEQAAVGIAHVAPDGRWLRVNSKFCDIVGYSPDELLKRSFQDITHQDDLDADLAYLRQMIAAERAQYSVEKRYIRKDGTTIWVNLTVSLTRDRSGAPDYFISVVEEITERKKTEAYAQGHREFLQKILESLTHPFYVIDARDYTVAMANAAAGRNIAIGSSTCFSVTHHRDVPCGGSEHECPLETVKKTKKPVAVEHTHFDAQGNARVLEVHGYPLFDAAGNVAQMIEYALDVTERKQAEDALHATSEELDHYFTISLDLLCIADTDGNFRRLNQAWESTLGYSRAEMMEQRFLDFVHPDDLEGTLAAVATLASQRQVIGFVNRYRCKDGGYRWLEWRSAPVGKIIYAVARDITERIDLEERLRRMNEDLEQRVQARTTELAARNEKLTTMNKLFVGRELRMAELKEKVREL